MGKGTYKVILRVASVILIILSVVSLIEMLINGSLVARFRAVIDAIIALSGIESAVISLLLLVLSALFELIAGIVGWRTGGGHAKPKTCRWLALIILVPSAINFLNSFSASGISWTALGGIVLPLVYFFAANNL